MSIFKRFFKREPPEVKTVFIHKLEWIDVNSALPPMYQSVIVFGRRKKENICRQVYEARRWGMKADDETERKKYWSWYTPCDQKVTDVTHWMPKPPVVLKK